MGQSAKIEQTGTLGLSVGRRDLTRAMAQLGALAGTDGGFVANSQTQSGSGLGGPPLGTVTLQVPVDNFSAALKQAQRIGRTTSLTTKATDVTGQYVDLQSRIAALDASRQQYLTIMTQATTVGDVLAVQAQLDTIESQLEQLQGQLQVLTSETSYSTLTANVSEGSPPSPPSPLPESGMVQAWHESVGGFLAGVEGVVRVAGPVLFALVVPRRRAGRRPGLVAALSAPPPLASVAQSPIAAANGIPGIVTTPTPPEGPTSSLTAIVPVARTTRGSNAVCERLLPDTTTVAPGAIAPAASTVRLDDETASAV